MTMGGEKLPVSNQDIETKNDSTVFRNTDEAERIERVKQKARDSMTAYRQYIEILAEDKSIRATTMKITEGIFKRLFKSNIPTVEIMNQEKKMNFDSIFPEYYKMILKESVEMTYAHRVIYSYELYREFQKIEGHPKLDVTGKLVKTSKNIYTSYKLK